MLEIFILFIYIIYLSIIIYTIEKTYSTCYNYTRQVILYLIIKRLDSLIFFVTFILFMSLYYKRQPSPFGICINPYLEVKIVLTIYRTVEKECQS